MDIDFKQIKYRFVRSFVDITDDLETIINSKNSKGIIKTKDQNKNLSFTKESNGIKINFEGEEFMINNEPITILNQSNECLFKIFDKTDQEYIDEVFNGIDREYDFYSEGKIIDYREIQYNNYKKIIIKPKTNEYNDIFKHLCKRITKFDKSLKINTNCLLPEDSQSLLINFNSDFQLIVEQRKILIDLLTDFMDNKDKYLLKIYGSDGIGKSVTFLYFMAKESKYKIVYFNLKDIYKYQTNPQKYFKMALMKYYSSSNFYNKATNVSKIYTDEYYNFCYKEYKKAIISLENNNEFLKGNFLNMLSAFCKYIKYERNALIILDQYKIDYVEGEINKINTILSDYGQNGSIKFIIASSLNDNSVKEDLIMDLMFIFQKEIKFIKLIKENDDNNDMEIEDKLFSDFEFGKDKKEINYNEDFSKISLFNMDDSKEKKNNDKIIENDNSFLDEYDKKMNDKLIESNKKKYEKRMLIYVNDLISVEELVKNSGDKELYKQFNYNPKAFTKYNFNIFDDLFNSKEDSQLSFLNSRFKEISEKVDTFYWNLNQRKFKANSAESLKGSFLIKLNEIIKNKVELNLKELIQSLEVYPFKYLKIYISDSDSNNKENIIYMDERLKDKKFILDYSYEFIEIAFEKILDLISSSTIIDMKDLSGSGVGSLLENKIKKNMEQNGFTIRYFWNFTSKQCKPTRKKYVYDFNKFERKELEYDDVKTDPIIDFNKYYYIVPGSQTNRALDSVILQPIGEKTFNMICLRITKFKKTIKDKEEYIKYCFKAKEKFEEKYKIKINKIYFYFILAKNFPNESNKIELEAKNIAYFYFSIKQNRFFKEGIITNPRNLNNIEAEIFENNPNQYQYFDSKLTLIDLMEKYLQKKRRSTKNMEITESSYEEARKYLFKKTSNIRLNASIKKEMVNIIKENNDVYKSQLFTFQFIFSLHLSEYFYLRKKEDLIGVKVYKETTKKIHYFYNGKIYPNNGDLVSINYFDYDEKQLINLTPIIKDYKITEIPKQYNDRIFVFRIYILNK